MYTMTGLDRLIGFDPQLLHDSVLTGINIFILFFFLSYLLFNPVRDILEKRKQKIAQELASAAGDMASASALKEEYEAKLKNVNKEAEDILEAARKKAKTRENEILDEARAEAEKVRADTQLWLDGVLEQYGQLRRGMDQLLEQARILGRTAEQVGSLDEAARALRELGGLERTEGT